MGLIFNRCSGHHYPDNGKMEHQVGMFLGKVCLIEVKKYGCKHDGCKSTKKDKTVVKRYDRQKFIDIIKVLKDYDLYQIKHALERYGGEV